MLLLWSLDFVLLSIYTVTCNTKLPTDYLAAYITKLTVMCLQLKFYQLRRDETGDVTVSSNGHTRPRAINSQT